MITLVTATTMRGTTTPRVNTTIMTTVRCGLSVA
jgi:hypothetical protein